MLPSIRRTGGYSIPVHTTGPDPQLEWLQGRTDSIFTGKLSSQVLDSIVTKVCTSPRDKAIFFAQFKNLINQTVLSFTETTAAYKKRKGIPTYVSLPEMLDGIKQHHKTSLELFIVDMAEKDKQMLQAATDNSQVVHWLRGVCAVFAPIFRCLPEHTLSIEEAKDKKKQIKRRRLPPSTKLLPSPPPPPANSQVVNINIYGTSN